MSVSEVTATVQSDDGTALPATAVRVTLDKGRVPFGQADVELPWSPEMMTALDPRRGGARLGVVLERRHTGSDRARDLTFEWGPTVIHRRQRLPLTIRSTSATAADLTAAHTGDTAADLTAAHGTPWNATTAPTTRRRFDLLLDTASARLRDGVLAVSAVTDEQVLMDFRLALPRPLQAGATARDVVLLALGMALPGSVLARPAAPLDPFIVEPSARVWEPGQSAWEFAEGATAAAGLRLWCDELRVWHLEHVDNADAPGPTRSLTTVDDVTDLADTITPAEGYADTVMVTYRWRDRDGVEHVARDIAGTGHGRVVAFTVDRPYPGAGEAAWRLRKARRAGRVLDVEAVLRPELYPSDAVEVVSPSSTRAGSLAAVTWAVPADTASVTVHDLQEA